MADFYQTGIIITLHKLGRPSLEKIESEMVEFSKHRPIALVLPALYTEFQAPALQGIIDELKKAKEFMAQIPYEVKIIHNEGKRIKEIYATLERNGLWAGEDGKGRSAWIAYGYILANGRSDVITLHDCDIVTYSREMLARLCYPVANPNIDVVFCKGFYSRVTDRMHGRVTRLLITPLVRALQKLVGFHPFLVFLDSFRYPLAGA